MMSFGKKCWKVISLVLCLAVLAGCKTGGKEITDFLQETGDALLAEPSSSLEDTQASQAAEESDEQALMPVIAPVKPEASAGEEDTVSSSVVTDEGADTKGLEYLTGKWGTDLPENRGIKQEWLDEFGSSLQSKPVHAVVLVKDGSIIYEQYDGGDTNYLYSVFSCTKSVTSAAVGIAMEQGYLAGIESKLGEFFPGVSDEGMKEITLEQLLNFSSGIEWSETTNTGMLVEWMFADNQVDYVLNSGLKYAPGERFQYNTGNSHLVSAILAQTTGMSEYNYVKKNIFEPIGITETLWLSDFQGVTCGGFGLCISARDAARFGQLYLNGGKWGERQVVPEEWVKVSTVKQAPDEEYGYNWWIDNPRPEQKYSMYYAAGYGGQYIFVVPEYRMVGVVTSNGIQDLSIVGLFKDFLDRIES